ncbi:MAG TPA: peptide ABC transporter permease [Gammaproteobacteria bacterium]|jgi:peptide/nickel transport system permease protein|nr:peptide ABC transporter permease [Gammaproteobacteria bacterium]HIA88213.1 ABC transporter permease [Gammaproteobacteria bacterium]
MPLQRFLSDYRESSVAVVSVFVVVSIAIIAVFAPWLAPTDPYDLAVVTVADKTLAPGVVMSSGQTAYLGTDGSGRDLLSGIFYGLRISLGVGIGSGVIALTIGVVVGLIAAYFGGRIDSLIMRLVDIQLSFPAILIALVLLVTLGKGVDKTLIALIVVQWAYYARTVRGSALVERGREYIEAAHCLALSKRRILMNHLFPNVVAPIIVVGTMQTAHAIALEATLSFLGLGMEQTEPSLGSLIANGFDYIHAGHYWITIFPGVALLVTIVSINLVGDRLRDVLNPRLQR